MELLKNFNGEPSDHDVSMCQRTGCVLYDIWNSCKEKVKVVKREREEELIELFVPDEENKSKLPGLMITDKELRRRGSRRGLPEHVRAKMEELGGVNPVLVITKFVTKTDLSKQHVRLSLPSDQFEEGLTRDRRFLTEAEWEKVKAKGGDVTIAMLVGPMCSEPTQVSLKSWSSPKGLVVTTGWGGFLAKYKKWGRLDERDAIQVWAARRNGGGDVLLALVVVGYAIDTTLRL